MDERLRAAYLATDYRVRLPQGGVARLRIGAPPPGALLALTHGVPWAVITAWNPQSQPVPRARNRSAQRALLAELRASPDVRAIRAAAGVGADGWREPSLLAIGLDADAARVLCSRYGQLAFVAGVGEAPPQLHWTKAAS